MTSKRNYSRYFIILQEDEKGYAIDQNKFPTGYAKVERKNNKCRVSYYVQNLKKSQDPYYMLLICDRKKDKRLIKLGKINIDDYGRSEVSYEYDINNVANCNIPMDNIKGASIVKIKDSNVHGILTGFVSGANLEDWKSYVVIEDEKREETKKKDNEEIKIEDKKNKEEKSKEEKSKEENIFDKYEKEVEEYKKISIKEDDTRDLNEEIVKDEEKLQENKKIIEEEEEIEIEEDRLEKVEDEQEEIEESELELDEEDTKDELEERLKEDMRDYISEEENEKEEEEYKDIDEMQDYEENNRQNSDLDKEDGDIEEDSNIQENKEESEEEKIEINHEDTRKYKDHKKSKNSKKDKEKLKSKEKEKDKCDNKYKYKDKDKEKKKSKDDCPYESNCHMNWEKEFYKHIVEGLKEENGICQEVGKCNWYKIQHTSLMNMKPGTDFSKYSILYYPMMNYYPYIMKRGHYIVGFKYDKNGKMRYLVYGIPGTKSMMDQPFNGATGFVTWVNKDINNMDQMNMGYWLMFYDFKNSTVVIPVKK
ncbi:hypothetical protein Z957_07400 [Clostridium sp. K25]|uniref:DUF7922 domain-containing protein n=1 Tax=Clostridium sp. K25 TaxID=1443109 RepID=UPI0004D3F7E5|nr:hypothetical protein [Clostridium sp. K25]KEI08342.1 hypothetical protein Z957_07400 [Clostridium sp. K25]